MNLNFRLARLPLSGNLSLFLVLILFLTSASWLPLGHASPVAAGESCANATVINPASLPFTDEATTVGAVNDIDPQIGSCAPGPGSDVVYQFTPSATDTYVIGVTPTGSTFDPSLYIVTDCSNPFGTCIAGANNHTLGKGETLTLGLIAGTQYFIVIDSAQVVGEGDFHFALRRGVPANDTCETATVIPANNLPFSGAGTTFGALNNLNPGPPCVRNMQAANGADVVYQFTSPDTQNYDLTVTPKGNYDVTFYVVTNCSSLSGCSSADNVGSGVAETLRRNLAAGQTFFIIVDGAQSDAGDFTISLVPTQPRTPAPPSNLSATAVSTTQINLSWTDNSSDEQGFRIERGLNGSDFTEVGAASVNVTTFNDTGLAPNTTYFYRVRAFNNFGNSEPSNVAADTTPDTPVPTVPVINVSPASLDFGSVRVNTTATNTVTISNAGGANLVITNITGPTGAFSIINRPATPFTIAPGQSRSLTVQFAPVAVAPANGSFSIQSNASTPNVTVNLKGTGTGGSIPNLELNPVDLNFPNGSSVATLELKNTGDADLLLASLQLPDFPFSVSGAFTPGTILKPGEHILLIVSFTPNSPGVFSSRLIIVNNDPDTLLAIVNLRGTSTPQNEQFKFRAPTIFNAVAGTNNTINVVAVNGTNTDIHLSATSVAGGTFTDDGNGSGRLVINPTATSGSAQVVFTAIDGAGRTKSIPTNINFISSENNARVALFWQLPTTASGPPVSALALDQFITPLVPGQNVGVPAAPIDGRAAYVIYRATTSGVGAQLSGIAGVVSPAERLFFDNLPRPANNNFSSFRFFYVVTALYTNGTESVASNETSTEPRLANLQFKSKRVKFDGDGSNVAAGAVLIVDGTERFTLEADGDSIVVKKNARSTPGNLRPKDIFKKGQSHQLVVLNPNNQTSRTVTLSR